MTSEFGHLHQRGVLPNENLILRVAMSADQFGGVFAPGQVAYLGPCVDALHRLTSQSVPETNAPVSCPATAC